MKFDAFIKWAQGLLANAHVVSTINGPDIDKRGFSEAQVFVDLSDKGAAGTLDVKVQQTGVKADGTVDTANYADVPLALIVQLTANGFSVLSLDLDPLKEFIRVVSTIAGNTLDAAVSVALIHPKYGPAVQASGTPFVRVGP